MGEELSRSSRSSSLPAFWPQLQRSCGRWAARRSAPAARSSCGARSGRSRARCWPTGTARAISFTASYFMRCWCGSGPERPVERRFFLALVVEAAWEIAENSPMIIDRYREATIALGYSGDSILNSAERHIDDGARLFRRQAAAGLGERRHRPGPRADPADRDPRQSDPQHHHAARRRAMRSGPGRPASGTIGAGSSLGRHVTLPVAPRPQSPCPIAAPAHAGELFGGVYVHDVDTPLTKSGIEGGADIQLGYRWDKIGKTPLQPYLFGAVNTAGETHYAAVGLSAKFGDRIFVRPGIGIAVHTGSDDEFNRARQDRVRQPACCSSPSWASAFACRTGQRSRRAGSI